MTKKPRTQKKKWANQYQPDPRQALFLSYYIDPKSESFANAYQSALRAGYTKDYAKIITNSKLDWLSDNLRELDFVKQAEKNLKKLLVSDNEKIQADMTKFTLERLKKEKYSSRTEQTGAEGKELQPILVKFINVEDN